MVTLRICINGFITNQGYDYFKDLVQQIFTPRTQTSKKFQAYIFETIFLF